MWLASFEGYPSCLDMESVDIVYTNNSVLLEPTSLIGILGHPQYQDLTLQTRVQRTQSSSPHNVRAPRNLIPRCFMNAYRQHRPIDLKMMYSNRNSLSTSQSPGLERQVVRGYSKIHCGKGRRCLHKKVVHRNGPSMKCPLTRRERERFELSSRSLYQASK